MNRAKVIGVSLLAAAVSGIWFTCAIMLGTRPGNATGSPNEIVSRPKAEFVETKRDFGKVHSDKEHMTTFAVRNIGGSPLHIVKVEVSCGCTKPQFPETIAPGAVGEIQVTFAPHPMWQGSKEKSLTVHTDDPANPVQKLILVADLDPPIRVSPGTVVRLLFRPGESASQEITLAPRSDKALTIRAVRSDCPRLKAIILSRDGSAREMALRIALVPTLESGDFSAQVEVDSSDLSLPTLTLDVLGEAQSGPVSFPSKLRASRLAESSKDLEFCRFVVGSRAGAIKVIKVTPDSKELRAEIGGTTTRGTEIVLNYTGGWQKGQHTGIISVITNDTKSPVLKVPYDAWVWSDEQPKRVTLK